MARNGIKTGGGSRRGKRNRKTAETIAAVESSGLTPLGYMLQVMRNESLDSSLRLDAGKAAAQYVHPKLQPIDGKTGSSEVRARVFVEFVQGSST